MLDNEINSIAYARITKKYNENPNEINEILWLYMKSVIMKYNIESQLYLDELENIIGINKHNEVLSIIMKE